MKQNLFALFLALLASVGFIYASNTQVDGIYYDFDSTNKTARVTYRGSYGQEYKNEYINRITIPKTVRYNGVTYNVTSIGREAFEDCSVSSVTIPESVTSIGERAFCATSYMTITIPNSVISIGSYAFRGSKISSITIPASVNSIGDEVFTGCSILSSIVVDAKNPIYDSRDNCNAIIHTATNTLIAGCRETVIPQSVTTIGNSAFEQCINLTSITIPNSVTTIEKDAFNNCRSLTSITIPSSVTSIGDLVFYNCESITSITCYAKNPPQVGQYAFSFIPTTIPVYVPCGSVEAYQVAERWKSFTNIQEPLGEYSITLKVNDSKMGFATVNVNNGCGNQISATPKKGYQFVKWNDDVTDNPRTLQLTQDTTLTAEFDYILSGQCGDNLYWKFSDTTLYITGTGNMQKSVPWEHLADQIKSIYVAEGVTYIYERAFDKCKSVTTILWNAKNHVDYIYDFQNEVYPLFYYIASQITSFILGDQVEHIPAYLCYNLYKLTTITFPEDITSVGKSAFRYCSGLTSFVWNAEHCADFNYDYENEDFGLFGDSYEGNIPNITSVVFGDKVEHIPANLCYCLDDLTSIVIPRSVVSIGDSFFPDDVTNLVSIVVENGNAKYDSRENCNALIETATNTLIRGCKNTIIPNTITTLANGALRSCSSLTSITIPNSVTTLGRSVFSLCDSLSSITIPNSVTSIGEYAFWNCLELTSATIGSNVDSIGDHAFEYCIKLTTITCNSPQPPMLGKDVFYYCNNWQTTYIPCGSYDAYKESGFWYIKEPEGESAYSVTLNVNDEAMGTAKVDRVSACGTTIAATPIFRYKFVKWSDGETENPRVLQLDADITLTAIFDTIYAGQCGDSLYWEYVDSTLYITGNGAMYNLDNDRLDNVPWKLLLPMIKSVEIGSGVSYIGEDAFVGCSKLTTITCLGEIPATAESGTFDAVSNAISVYVPCGSVNAYKNARGWNVFTKIQEPLVEYLITIDVNNVSMGTAQVDYHTFCEGNKISATANYGYSFVKWDDGNTDNPRSLDLTQDTILAPIFTIKQYTISTSVNDTTRGSTQGDTTVNYLDSVTITATSNYGYHFVQWNDGNTEGSRQVQVTGDKTYTAEFEKNTYSVYLSSNEEQGEVESVSAAYLDTVTISATPNVGYHFVQWNDGNTDNPRTLVLTQDITLTAEFAQSFSGQCGDNLYWELVDTTLHITGSGKMYDYNSNTVPWKLLLSSIKSLTVAEGVTKIGDNAFDSCTELESVVWDAKDYMDFYSATSQEITVKAKMPDHWTDTITAWVWSTGYAGRFVTPIKEDEWYRVTEFTNELNIIFLNGTGWSSNSNQTEDMCFYGNTCITLTQSYSQKATYNTVIFPGNTPFIENSSQIKSFTFGEAVEHIPAYLCKGMTNLTSVTIPNSVTSIGTAAFSGCSSLTSITCEAENPPTVYDYAFYNVSTSIPVYVPCGQVDAYKAASGWSNFTNIQEPLAEYLIEVNVDDSIMGTAKVDKNNACGSQISATPNYGYHFVQWSDGSTDTIRTLELTHDTTLIAEFAPNQYTVTTLASHNERGTTEGDTTVNYLEYIPISAAANYGYHFVQWNDGNTEKSRQVQVTEDKTYTADFEKNTYSVSLFCNNELGSVKGATSAKYLDAVTISATPNYGYHFVQWSDGSTDTIRTLELTQDITLTAEFAPNQYTVTTLASHSERGTTQGDTTVNYLDSVTITANSNYGYHFVQWNDGNTESSRQVQVTGDTTYTAEFEKNTYSISLSCNEEQGAVESVSAAYLDTVTISATPNVGYHFVQWNDGSTDNPRTLVLTQDITLTAEFAQSFSGKCGDNQYWELIDTTLHITGSGAMYDYTPNAAPWTLIRNSIKSITVAEGVTKIGDNAFDSCTALESIVWNARNYADAKDAPFYAIRSRIKSFTFGEAVEHIPAYLCYGMEKLTSITTPNSLKTIGTSAFEGCARLGKITLGTGLEKIAANAFAGCTRLYDIYTYATYPPFAEESSFANYNVYVYIPCEYQRDYTLDVVWGKFKFIECIESEDATTDGNVTVDPGYNDVTITWPTDEKADSYSLVINKAGEPFCTLTFNAKGQLLNIAFAPGRGGSHAAPYALQTVSGYRFTVTGLTEATKYAYDITTKDATKQTIAAYSGEFTTKGGTTTAVEDILQNTTNVQKILRNGQLIIVRDGVEYNAMGQEM